VTGAGAPMSRPEAAALLGVPDDAGPAEVQHAYLRAARRTHPDLQPEADETARRAASESFDRLTRARDLLLTTRPERAPEWLPGPEGDAGPRYRRVEGRGLGGSLVVLALLAFLLVALVSAQQAFGGAAFPEPVDRPATTATP
jgi:hypothetical protein